MLGKKGRQPMRITSKGQVTIPQAVRERAGMLPNTEVEFLVDGDLVILVKAAQARKATRGTRAVAALRGARPAFRMTTEELMALTRGEL
jgi:AbrB family looped-hinge helix DNA binding protein